MSNKIVDKRPKSGGEFFNFCKIIVGNGRCFICDLDRHEDVPVYVLVANVTCRESAMRILEMFSHLLSSDGCYYDHENNQIKINACKEHYSNLEALKLTDGKSTDGIIDIVKIVLAISAH